MNWVSLLSSEYSSSSSLYWESHSEFVLAFRVLREPPLPTSCLTSIISRVPFPPLLGHPLMSSPSPPLGMFALSSVSSSACLSFLHYWTWLAVNYSTWLVFEVPVYLPDFPLRWRSWQTGLAVVWCCVSHCTAPHVCASEKDHNVLVLKWNQARGPEW